MWRKFWGCFLCWQLPPRGRIKDADALFGLSFGGNYHVPKRTRPKDPGLCNWHLALAAHGLRLMRGSNLPLALQEEVNDSSPKLSAELVVTQHRRPGCWLGTYEVLDQMRELARARGWKKIAVVGHPEHLPRIVWVLEKMGFEVIVPSISDTTNFFITRRVFDEIRWSWRLVELLRRLEYLLRGYL